MYIEKTITCECGNELIYSMYNSAYNCECGNCYNLGGQKLRAFEEWEHDYFNDEY